MTIKENTLKKISIYIISSNNDFLQLKSVRKSTV